jgi:hypothetical protein
MNAAEKRAAAARLRRLAEGVSDGERARLRAVADSMDGEADSLGAQMKAQPKGSIRTEMQMRQQQSKEEPKKE